MAETRQSSPLTKQEILAQLAANRVDLQLGAHRLHRDLNISTKLKQSVAKSPGSWLSAAAFGGLVFSLLPKGSRRKESRKERKRRLADQNTDVISHSVQKAAFGGTLIALIKLLLPIIKPALTSYASGRVATYVKKR